MTEEELIQAPEEAEAPVAEDSAPPAESGPAPAESAGDQRDFAGEIAELKREFPEAVQGGELPDEVVHAVVREGKSVLAAWRDYALSHPGESRPAPRSEPATGRAPVRGVSGGWPVGNQARDAFLTGFDE